MHTQQAVFGGGCFWCTEAVFLSLRGVLSVTSGYAGGMTVNPTYEQVSAGNTGHAEVISLEYNEEEITYKELLTVFFASHDPTTLNRQGADVGTQYRSVIFYTSDSQKKEAEAYLRTLTEGGLQVVTTVEPLPAFYAAEAYHQGYYRNNTKMSYCQVVIEPKLEKVQQAFAQLLKDKRK